MPTPINPSEDNPSTYLINGSDPREIIRLTLQGMILTQVMDKPLVASLDIARIHSVLDIGCGPGDWALSLARRSPHLHVVGMDISRRMVEYAQGHAKAQGIHNVEFHVVDILKPWPVPDHPFDFINGRLLTSFMPREAWPWLIGECLNSLQTGGVLRLTEEEMSLSNGAACEELAIRIIQAMYQAGTAFDERKIGVTVQLAAWLRAAGLRDIETQAHVLEYSHGCPAHEAFYQNACLGYPLLTPFLVKQGVATQEECETLYQQAMTEMQREDFKAVLFLLTAWGIKGRAFYSS